MAADILRHRLVLSYDALADDIPADRIIDRVLATVPLPTVAPRQHAGTGPPPGNSVHRPPSYGAPARTPTWPAPGRTS